MFTPPGDHKRNVQKLVVVASFALIILYAIKIAYPQHSAVTIYKTHFINSQQNSVNQQHNLAGTAATPFLLPTPPVSTHIDGTTKSPPLLNYAVPDRAAVIIESRFRFSIIPLILHFGSILGPAWPILIYTSPESIGQFSSAAALSRYIRLGEIQLRLLPQDVLLTNINALNQLMTSEWIWESLAPAEHILFFQSDSTLCGNAARSVEDYFQYDFLGASLAADYKMEEMGLSLSLRRRSSMLRVLGEFEWESKAKMNEDEWFIDRLRALHEQEFKDGVEPTEEGAVNLADPDMSHTFTVQRMGEYANPLGVHQVHRWRKEDLEKLEKWCPEFKLCSGDFGWTEFEKTEVEKEEERSKEKEREERKKQEQEERKKTEELKEKDKDKEKENEKEKAKEREGEEAEKQARNEIEKDDLEPKGENSVVNEH